MLVRRPSALRVDTPVTARSGRRASAYLQILGGLLLALLALVAGLRLLHASPVDAGTVPQGRPTAAGHPVSIPGRTAPARRPVAAPRRLSLPALGVAATVVPVTADAGGSLGVPEDVHQLGWWAGGAAAGSPTGTVVIDGHVDSAAAGAGALFHLDAAPLGAAITLEAGTTDWSYRIVARRSYPKDRLPADVFATGGSPRLVLITCGGHFDHTSGHYADNTVVYAVPT